MPEAEEKVLKPEILSQEIIKINLHQDDHWMEHNKARRKF